MSRSSTWKLSVANSYSRGDREFEKATAVLFPSEIAQRGRIGGHCHINRSGNVMYGRPRCCKGKTDLKRRVSLPSCIRPFRCGTLTAGPDGIREIGCRS